MGVAYQQVINSPAQNKDEFQNYLRLLCIVLLAVHLKRCAIRSLPLSLLSYTAKLISNIWFDSLTCFLYSQMAQSRKGENAARSIGFGNVLLLEFIISATTNV